MRLVIVEDDPHKCERLEGLVIERFPRAVVSCYASYRSGLSHLLKEPADVVLMDMTMPTFDIKPGKSGGRMRGFAGLDIMRELLRRKIVCRVVVVTQFEAFGDEPNRMTLHELEKELAETFPESYAGCVYYNAAQTAWQDSLAKLVLAAGK